MHIIHIDKDGAEGLTDYLGEREVGSGTGPLDHIAFVATGLSKMRENLRSHNQEFQERTVPDLGLHQVFIHDPNGIMIELNFPASEVH